MLGWNGRETRLAWGMAVAVALALAACGSGSEGGGEQADGPAEAAAPDASTPDASADAPTPPGSGAVAGSIASAPFGAVATALWAGAPDDPATTVVYLVTAPVACSELATPGWDTRIADKTSVLEMKAFGTTPADYKVVTTLTPAPGEASVNYTLSSRTGTPKEVGSTAGKLTLQQLTPSTSVTGSFAFTFPSGSLTGTFDAVFCPGAHEP